MKYLLKAKMLIKSSGKMFWGTGYSYREIAGLGTSQWNLASLLVKSPDVMCLWPAAVRCAQRHLGSIFPQMLDSAWSSFQTWRWVNRKWVCILLITITVTFPWRTMSGPCTLETVLLGGGGRADRACMHGVWTPVRFLPFLGNRALWTVVSR